MRVRFSEAMFDSFAMFATAALLLRKIALDACADYLKALAACRRLRRRRRHRLKAKREPVRGSRLLVF
jgi:hypothetical protein